MDDKLKLQTIEQQNSWVLSKVGVLVMLFAVLGPFGLKLLYKSSHFSKNAKIFFTVGVLVYTGVIMVVLVGLVMYIYHMVGQLLIIS